MKAFFEAKQRQNINPEHRHDAHLDGQIVAIDCAKKKEIVRLDLYKKGQRTYYCCLWIDNDKIYITGSGKGKSRFEAVYAALESAGVSFEPGLPELGRNFDLQVWDKLEPFVGAIAQTAEATNCYTHNCLRSN